MIYAQPLIVAGIARLVLGETLRPRQIVGLLVGWAGIALTVLGQVLNRDPGPHVWQAALFFLGAAVCFALGTIVVKGVTSGPARSPCRRRCC